MQYFRVASPVIQDVMQQGCDGRPLGGGLFIQETPGAVLAHNKLLKHNTERKKVKSASKTENRPSNFSKHWYFFFLPAAFCQTSGFRCWRKSRLRAESALLYGWRICRSEVARECDVMSTGTLLISDCHILKIPDEWKQNAFPWETWQCEDVWTSPHSFRRLV